MKETIFAEELNKKAQSLMKREHWKEAIDFLQINKTIVKKQWELSWNLGWCYFKLEQFDDARKYLINARKLAPKNHICYWALGTVYQHLHYYKRAEKSLINALKIKDSYLARLILALVYLQQGKFDEAENIHLEGIKLKPQSSERYKSYANFLSDVGREKEAQRMYKKAERLNKKADN